MKIIEGDLTEFPNGINVAFHNCNVWNVMGAGIAKQFRTKYPEVFEADKNFSIEKGLERLGWYSEADVGSGKKVVNLYGQDLYVDKPFNIGAYQSGLQLFLMDNQWEDDFVLGFPWMIGAGLARGDWQSIKDITEWNVDGFNLDAYWVKYNGN